MLDILKTVIGLAVGFYVLKGMLGKSREGDFTKLLMALAAFMAVIFLKWNQGA